MMKKHNRPFVAWSLLLILLAGALVSCGKKDQSVPIPTDHQIRSLLIHGNENYHKERYAEAATDYSKAFMLDSTSLVSMFNLSTALLRQGDMAKGDSTASNPINQAMGLLSVAAQQVKYPLMASMSFYDLGNVAYARQQWDKAVELYKNALRANPNDDEARDNLRLAQLKLQQSKNDQDQKNQQNQGQGDQDQQKQDQQKQDQQKQDQQKQDQQKQDQDQGDQSNDKQDPASQGQSDKKNAMSQQNADQVLKAMQDQERATQQRVNAQRAQQQRSERARTSRRW